MPVDFLSDRVKNIKPSSTFSFAMKAKELKAKGVHLYDFGLGEPDFEVPRHIKNAAIAAIENNKNRYTPIGGSIELKKAIVSKFAEINGIDYETNEVMASNGAKQVIFNALMSTINPGDEVIIFSPFWSSYYDMIEFCQGKPVVINTLKEDNYTPRKSQILEHLTNKTKWIMLNSPCNPTGAIYSKDTLIEIGSTLSQFSKLMIMSDEIYEHIIYDNNKHYSLAALMPEYKNRILTINGCSKAYGMTGWRLGFAGGNKALISAMDNIQSQATSNPCSISQEAAIVALNTGVEFLSEQLIKYTNRRNFLYEEINKISGLDANLPEGSFYMFVSVKDLLGKYFDGRIINSALDFCNLALESQGLVLMPGDFFGANDFFRISFACEDESVRALPYKLEKFCSNISDL